MVRLITLSILIFFPFLVYSQLQPGVFVSDYENLTIKINLLYGEGKYQVTDLINVDSALGKKWITQYTVEDPYGSLSHCYLFTAVGKIQADESFPPGFFGILKNGNIIWQSDTLISSDNVANAGFVDVSDINGDGKVEIVSYWEKGMNGGNKYLWIARWDGLSGRLLNDYDSNGNSGIVTFSDDLEFIDALGNGVKEIMGKWYDKSNPDVEVQVVYCWDGLSYNGCDLPRPVSLPKNKAAVTVVARASKRDHSYRFSYKITNSSSSLQSLENFVLSRGTDSIMGVTCRYKWDFILSQKRALLLWEDIDALNLILPSEIDSSFSYECMAPPTIMPYYIQGHNGVDTTDDIFTNSIQGFTISPVERQNDIESIDFIDTLNSFVARSREIGWIKSTLISDKYFNLFSSIRTDLQMNNIAAARTALNTVLHDVDIDSSSTLTSEAYALLRYNTEFLKEHFPSSPPSGCNVKLINSNGARLPGGALQYYEGSWKDAVNNNDGTFSVNTTQKTVSLRMTYEYGSQTKSSIPVTGDTVVFQTVNAQVKLQNSRGTPIDTGTVQYYAGAWRSLGTTISGMASKELLAGNYSFRITYAYASMDKQQDVGTNPTVIFQTVNAAVQLQNGQGVPIDTGTVQYYSGAWRGFGTTTNGVTTKELLPNNYSFRMTYAYASKDKQQDIGTNPTVVFQTVNAAVQLENSQGVLIDQGTVQYYSGAWRAFGTTTNGVVMKELLPNNYSFRMTYEYASKDKQQDIGTNPTVIFQTVNAIVQLKNSQAILIDQGTVQYYSGAWRAFGITINGSVSKELLPNNYTFRMTNQYVSNDKAQDVSANNLVVFSTVLCTIRVKNSQNQPIDNATASYYSGAWRQIGTTLGGEITKDLLPANLTFRVKSGTTQQDKTQNITTNGVVEFVMQP